jgi:hypothetical protein
MPSQALSALVSNQSDLERLWEIHEAESGGGRGRPRRDVDVINRAAMVLIASVWEAFCEDLLLEAASAMARDCPTYEQLPSTLQGRIGREMAAAKDDRAPWRLAGDGWRTVVVEHGARQIEALNTPKTKQVKQLFEQGLGLADITARWCWAGASKQWVAKRLDHCISVRGQIAHRVRDIVPVRKQHTQTFFAHVERLAELSDGAAATHVHDVTGIQPW